MVDLKHPSNIQIEITELCNHKCFYCYNSWQINKNQKAYMTFENSNKIIDKVTYEVKPFSVTLTGGEPFLNLPVLKNFIEKLPKKNMSIGVNTNLSYSTPKNLEFLLDSNNKFGMLISLPHFKLKKYEFITKAKDLDNIYNNLSFIKKSTNIPIMINMVVSKVNIDSIYEEGKFLYENFDIKKFSATPVSTPPLDYKEDLNYDLEPKDITSIYTQLKKLSDDFNINVDSLQTIPLCFIPEEIRMESLYIFQKPCSTGKGTLAFDYKGNMRSCVQSPLFIGNILDSKFESLWDKLRNFRNKKNLPTDCLECDILNLCNGGCRFNGYNEDESLDRKDPRMINRIKLKQKKENNEKEINLNENYVLSENFKYRKEDKDMYTFFESGSVMVVNTELKNFILNMNKLGSFNPNEILNNYKESNIKIQLKEIFDNLIVRNFLKKINL